MPNLFEHPAYLAFFALVNCYMHIAEFILGIDENRPRRGGLTIIKLDTFLKLFQGVCVNLSLADHVISLFKLKPWMAEPERQVAIILAGGLLKKTTQRWICYRNPTDWPYFTYSFQAIRIYVVFFYRRRGLFPHPVVGRSHPGLSGKTGKC